MWYQHVAKPDTPQHKHGNTQTYVHVCGGVQIHHTHPGAVDDVTCLSPASHCVRPYPSTSTSYSGATYKLNDTSVSLEIVQCHLLFLKFVFNPLALEMDI